MPNFVAPDATQKEWQLFIYLFRIITFHYITLHYITLHYITLHNLYYFSTWYVTSATAYQAEK